MSSLTRLLVASVAAITMIAGAIAGPAAAIVAESDYSSNPASAVSCINQQGTTICMIDAPLDAGSTVALTVGSATASLPASGGPQTFALQGTSATSGVVSFVVSGVTYTATVVISNIVVPTATPVATAVPTSVPGTVTPIDYGFGNGIPTKPAPLAITGSNSRFLIAGGLAMVLGGVLLMQRRPDREELRHDS